MTSTQSIEQVVAAVQQRWGANALRRLEQMTARTTGIPTGYAALDGALGMGGLPRGALTCLSGSPTCGKTTLALDILACVQGDGEVTVVIDMTGALDPEYAEQRGVVLERLLVVWPQPPALGLDIARDLVASGGAGLVVLDMGVPIPWGGPIGTTLRQLSATVRRSSYAVLCLTSGASGGLSATLSARADIHLQAERVRWRVDAEGVTGCDTRLTVVRSRFAPPGRSVMLPVTLSALGRRAKP